MKDLHSTNAGLNDWCSLIAKNTATADIERLLLANGLIARPNGQQRKDGKIFELVKHLINTDQ